jgi:hypothetical protein
MNGSRRIRCRFPKREWRNGQNASSWFFQTRIAGLMGVMMTKGAASAEREFLSLAGMGVLRGIKIRFLLIQ